MEGIVKGKITYIDDVQSGIGKESGKEWKKVLFVVSNNSGFEGKEIMYAFDFFGKEKVDKFLQYNKVGKEVEVSFRIESKKYNDRFFTNLSAWKCFSVKKSSEDKKEDHNEEVPF
tara:strand:- start:22 stop:366 length:345 start_codon:yes stop_codon:yes gene_type:complete